MGEKFGLEIYFEIKLWNSKNIFIFTYIFVFMKLNSNFFVIFQDGVALQNTYSSIYVLFFYFVFSSC